MMRGASLKSPDGREQIKAALNHLDHVLPGQAPIHHFVHHNTLHGYQHLPFEEALTAAERLTGICSYLPESKNREFYRQGRINDEDLAAALAYYPYLQAEQIVCTAKDKAITRQAIYRCALLFDLSAVSIGRLNWLIEELDVLGSVQADVPEPVRRQLLADGLKADSIIRQLWDSLLIKLNIQQAALHCEAVLDLSLEQVEEWQAQIHTGASVHEHTQQLARQDLQALLSQVGYDMTLRGFVLALSGIDILDSVRPQLIRICASAMDEGIAAWHIPQADQPGLYAAWRLTLNYDANLFLHELPDWQQIIAALPEDALDTIILQLTELGIPQPQWEDYLQRLSLEVPGWSGLINWRQRHPDYQPANDTPINLADYLAIRLTLDRLWLNQVCRDTWKVEANLGSLEGYFNKNLSEFLVRRHLYQGDLPEYLTQKAEALIIRSGSERHNRHEWQKLADLIQTWQLSPMAQCDAAHSPGNNAWRLFRLCQHLGLGPNYLQQLDQVHLQAMLSVLDEFNSTERSKVWLFAYERNYREDLFQALRANHKRGRWVKRERRPDAQVVCCMDEREESFRRHLEELNPAIETLGAAGFFGVAMNYQGLDDSQPAALCPVVVTPDHYVQEAPSPGNGDGRARRGKGRHFMEQLADLWYHGLRRNLLLSHAVIDLSAPFALVGLLGKILVPGLHKAVVDRLQRAVLPPVPTRLQFTLEDNFAPTNDLMPKQGFTDSEQAERVAALLRILGLTYGFAPIITLAGHGSTSQNNPHEAAHDCGACGGRQGGPNARVFAAMANRPQVRALLTQQGIDIPDDCWFVGMQHDTCSDGVTWYDLDAIPDALRARFERCKAFIGKAQQLSAHERCRRFASVPISASPADCFRHVTLRAQDLSQVRPEFGHATNAAAVIGRRAITQGLFLDRRVFLISYDSTEDPEGKNLESILLTAGPVGAGINLEYYFSTVNNERFGCGTKIPHNVTGFFGVMEGAGSDLRTGLPIQMVEIHEAMRLQIIVEAKTAVLERIYKDQPSLRELIAGGWVHLSTLDPDTGALYIFDRAAGFISWQSELKEVPVCADSFECYRDQSQPVSTRLIKQPDVPEFR